MKNTWYGKENAIIESMTPSTGALRPDKESSKNWDDTENLYIEGDNLEVLKLLQKSYFGKVKMIYIDPPYNTGKDFVYKDNFRDNITNYKEITSQTTKANPETNARYHTDWLNMMYPRLKLARNLLRDDGVIFISIGQDEVHNIIKICDEIYGERNRIGICSRVMKSGGNKGNFFSPNIDYVLVYSKDIDLTKYFRDEISDESLKNYYNNIETDGLKKGERFGAERIYVAGLDYRPNQRYWIECPDGSYVIPPGVNFPSIIKEGEKITPNSQDGVWKWTYERYLEEKNSNNILFKETKTSALINQDGEKSKYNLYNKIWLNDRLKEGRVPSDFITKYENRHSSKELKELKIPFSFAKPTGLIKYLMSIMNHDKSDIILDFFSGSATTADAVIQLNLEDGLQRKFIMVQLPEKTDQKSEAYKVGYKNICEIGKERLRRAGDKIISENKDKEGIENLDIGFKVFKLEYNCGGENHSMMEEGIKVDIIKRPKDKSICKFKMYGELYYLVKTTEDIIVFPYKSSIKGKSIASIFNIELCKNKDYMQLEYLYNMKLNEFNGEDFAHSQYVTSVILDNVYKNLNE